MTDYGLERRAEGARTLVREGHLDGELALTYVVWPSPDLDRLCALLPTPAECLYPNAGIGGYEKGCRCSSCRGAKRLADNTTRKRSA